MEAKDIADYDIEKEFSTDYQDDLLGAKDFGFDSISPMEKHADLLKELTDFDPFIQEIARKWLGLVWNDKKKEYVLDTKTTPIMNEKGADWCINFLLTYARKNNIITDLKHEDYIMLVEDVIDVAYLNVGTRAEEFGIKDDGDILLVCTQLIHAAMLVLMGAGGQANYKDLLQATITRSENVTHGPQPEKKEKKKGFFQWARKLAGG